MLRGVLIQLGTFQGLGPSGRQDRFAARPLRYGMTLMLLALFAVTGYGQAIHEKVDWPAFMARHDMHWDRLPKGWTETPHFGNATLGSMLYSSGEIDPAYVAQGRDIVNSIRLQVFRNGVYDHRDNSFGWTAYSRPSFNIGSFTIKPASKIRKVIWRKDLWNAELTGTILTLKGAIRIRHYVHAEDPAIVTELWTTPGEASCQWTWTAEKAQTTRPLGKLQLRQPNPEGRLEKQGEVNVWVQDLLYGGQYATAWAEFDKGGGHRVHVASIANQYPERTARDEAVKAVADWHSRDLDAAAATHREWWHRYYQQSFVSLPDKRLESLYWQTIYRYGSTARTGRYIVDLGGIWSQHSDWPYLVTDFNIQSALWAVYAANRLEIGGELIEMFHRGREQLARNVLPAEWQSDSALLNVCTQPDLIGPRDQDMRYDDLVGCLPWALHNCWWQYRYSMDDVMLREKLFPLLRRAVNLYLHMLKDEGGRLHLRTYSPETGTWEDCNFDLALLRWGCQTLLWSAERLKIDDPLAGKWRDVLERLVDFPVDENGYRLGSDQTSDPHHRHGSHLMMIYPLSLVNIDQPEKREVMRRSVERYCKVSSLPEMVSTFGVPFAAVIGEPELALKRLQMQVDCLLPNGMAWGPFLESSLSLANGIQTMLLQSWGDTIRVFPAMPRAWPDAVFHDLRAEGAFLVSARREAGKTRWVRIRSLAGEPCRVKPNFEGQPHVVGGDPGVVLKQLGDGVYEIGLAKGQEVVLAAESKGAPFTVDALPAAP